MALTWVICGAGRRVGKTTLSRGLCEVLPHAAYAKQGCGTKKPDKPANFFRSEKELTAFIKACPVTTEHIVLESNEQAHKGRADLIIFLDGIPGLTDYREDVDILRSRAHLRVCSTATRDEWMEVLRHKLESGKTRAAVCDVLLRQQRHPDRLYPPIRRVEPFRISTADASAVRDPCDVVVEQLLNIMVDGVGNFAVMCTPCDVEALAVGFVFSEGLISSFDDVLDCSYHPDQHAVGLRLDDPGRIGETRNMIVTSSCGLCGSRNIEQLMSGDNACADTLRVSASLLKSVAEKMQSCQRIFSCTGGTHAAGIFSKSGELLAVAEDIGRHNALDKVIGKCLVHGLSADSRGVMLSGRVSLELIAKAARAGLEIIAAVSAPSSLAIDAAERCNITLCCFVRGERATVYTHPHRIQYKSRQDHDSTS